MCRFIESICWENGDMPLIALHQQRFEHTQAMAFGKMIHGSLEGLIFREAALRPNLGAGKYKCRVLYDDRDISIEFTAYHKAKIDRLKIVSDDDLDYHFKYEDRSRLNRLKSGLPEGTEILIVKNNLIADTSFTNVALYDGNRWITPAVPLLRGVRREYLIKEKIIFPGEIRLNDLRCFSKIKLFNAMVRWDESWLTGLP